MFDHGPDAEDGPGTWEALASPRPRPVSRRAGDPSPTHDTLAGARVVGPMGTDQAPAAREAPGKGNQSWGRRGQGVGGRQRSVDVGERGDTRPRPSNGGPCRGDLQERTMPKALTLAHMSPGLVQGVETCNHEPHRRKSRMRESRSSGSGEGPGWVTSWPTLQGLLAPSRRQGRCRPPRRTPGSCMPPRVPPRTLADAGQASQDGVRVAPQEDAARRAPGWRASTTGYPEYIPTVSPLTIPLVYCHINSFQRASSVAKPWPGGEKRRDGRASHPEEW